MPNQKICETLFKLVMCHLVGDYVLQIDFIAKTKGENWYHLLVYCLPFYQTERKNTPSSIGTPLKKSLFCIKQYNIKCFYLF